jgi:anti-anti-sigma regulatory factor
MQVLRCDTIWGINVVTLDIQSLDAVNVAYVTGAVKDAMAERGPTVVDLGSLRYFDVSGFAAILKWAATPPVRLCSRAGTIHALLDLLQADSVIKLYLTRDDAISSLQDFEVGQRSAVSSQSRDGDPLPDRRTA